MAAINKNFVIKNGLEVNTNLIFADIITDKVGIGTTNPQYTLHVSGGIGVTNLYVSGVSTFVGFSTFNDYVDIQDGLRVIGVSTFVGFSTFNDYVNIQDGLRVIGVSTFAGITTVTGTTLFTKQLNVSGVSTFAGITTVTGTTLFTKQLNVSGVSTFVGFSTFNDYVDIQDGLNVTGAGGTFTTLNSTNGTITNLTGTSGTITTFNSTNGTITNLTGTSGTITTFNSTNGTITNLTGTSGTITTFNSTNGTITNLTGTSGTITTFNSTNGTITNLTGTSGTITTFNSTNGTITNLTGTAATITTLRSTTGNFTTGYIVTGVTTNFTSTNGTITNLTGTAATIGTVRINSGIITASSGIVTYYGDGSKLTGVISGAGVGVATAGGTVGTGATLLDFRGAGISTVTVASGIATINITGGGGGSSVSISSVAPSSPTNGNLWYNIDYGRTFIYYDEVALGIGLTAVWVDAAPFNVGIITSLTNVSFNPGSASSPSIYFVGDVQTGFFSPALGNITFVSAGSSVLNVNANGIVVTGVTTSTDFNSSSDASLKKDIVTIPNGLELVEKLRGVNFTWIADDRPSTGVIAQEVEEVLPQIVGGDVHKAVNYNGLIGVLIEAVKELSAEVKKLKDC